MTRMIEVKVADLEGAALDWAVAIAIEASDAEVKDGGVSCYYNGCFYLGTFEPSIDWAQGGPLIEKYKPWISPPVENQPFGWDAEIFDEAGNEVIGHAIGCSTALIAVCRAIVVAKLGDTVSVPAELVDGGEV